VGPGRRGGQSRLPLLVAEIVRRVHHWFEPIRKPHAIAAYAAKYVKRSQQKSVLAVFENVGRLRGPLGA
jgi:hypothetical protein